MSITAMMLRLATVQALMANSETYEVRDSAIAPIDKELKESTAPYLGVFVDQSSTATKGTDLLAGPQELHLVLQFGVTVKNTKRDDSGRPVKDGRGATVTEAGVPVTDAGLELQLDIIQRKALLALQVSGNPWAEIWRRLVRTVDHVEMRRGADDNGIRYAARELVFRVQVIRDPGYQAGLSGVWPDALSLLEGDANLSYLAGIVRSLAGEGGELPHWRVEAAQAGLSLAAARAMLVSPPPEAEATAPHSIDADATDANPVFPA